MNTCTRIRVVGMLTVLMLGSIPSGAAIIDVYQDDFSGGGGDLNGTAPDIRPGSQTWSASSKFNQNGTVEAATGRSVALLPFAPQQGNVYVLSADMRVTTGTSWLALGFSDLNTSLTRTFYDAQVVGYGWAYLFPTGGIGGMAGPQSTGGTAITGPTALDGSRLINVQITFDTTAAAATDWTMQFKATDKDGAVRESVAVKAASGNYNTISWVGFGQNSDPNFTGGVVDNFSLQIIPEPATLSILGLGAVALLLRRRFARVA